MKIVIDIPEELFNIAKDGMLNEIQSMFICGSVSQGRPLPKGHGRLIDADRVVAEATERMKYPANHQYMECVIAHMGLASTIIEADTESEEV